MEAKKYNSILTLAFSVDHMDEYGGDVTPADVRQALNKRVANMTDDKLWQAIGGIRYFKDTYER